MDRNNVTGEAEDAPEPTFPARGTWIEIMMRWIIGRVQPDVPRKGNVDRNPMRPNLRTYRGKDVPRKGNVDRNIANVNIIPTKSDVPRKGNVDRNVVLTLARGRVVRTFPARGTWIEIVQIPD